MGRRKVSQNLYLYDLIFAFPQAYRKWVKEHWEEPRLPGMMLTNEQVFFISFARVSEGRMILTQQN